MSSVRALSKIYHHEKAGLIKMLADFHHSKNVFSPFHKIGRVMSYNIQFLYLLDYIKNAIKR